MSTDALEGEVVDPGKVIICERGKAPLARALMDGRGEYGGVIRESDVCPAGQVVVIDMDLIKARLVERLEERIRFAWAVPPPLFRLMNEILRRAAELASHELTESLGPQCDGAWFSRMHALVGLVEGLREHPDATVAALDPPGTCVKPEPAWGGYAVFGWWHILHLPGGRQHIPEFEVSFHNYRWTARRAARKWAERVRPMAARLANDLGL